MLVRNPTHEYYLNVVNASDVDNCGALLTWANMHQIQMLCPGILKIHLNPKIAPTGP